MGERELITQHAIYVIARAVNIMQSRPRDEWKAAIAADISDNEGLPFQPVAFTEEMADAMILWLRSADTKWFDLLSETTKFLKQSYVNTSPSVSGSNPGDSASH